MNWDGFHRVGHGGASALAPANTLASFDAAARVGVEVIEFDVRRWRDELVLAHTIFHAQRGGNVRFTDAVTHLSGPQFADLILNVDVKHPGFEAELLTSLRDAGLLERTLISSQVAAVADTVRELDADVRTGISVGGRAARASRGWRDWRGAVLDGLASGRWDAVMVQHRLFDARLREEVGDRGGRVYAWTVNERRMIESLQALGVDGIATADPRLFACQPHYC